MIEVGKWCCIIGFTLLFFGIMLIVFDSSPNLNPNEKSGRDTEE